MKSILNKKGLTLLELIIVLAIIAILSAIIVPSFANTTDKARLKGDVQSAKVLQNAFELYDTEQSEPITKSDLASAVEQLNEKGYLSKKEYKLQTHNAKWVYSDTDKLVKVDIGSSKQEVKDAAKLLTSEEQLHITQ